MTEPNRPTKLGIHYFGGRPIIFDLDVFQQRTFEPTSPEIWEQFAKLRELRNRVFFGSITERTKEMFR